MIKLQIIMAALVVACIVGNVEKMYGAQNKQPQLIRRTSSAAPLTRAPSLARQPSLVGTKNPKAVVTPSAQEIARKKAAELRGAAQKQESRATALTKQGLNPTLAGLFGSKSSSYESYKKNLSGAKENRKYAQDLEKHGTPAAAANAKRAEIEKVKSSWFTFGKKEKIEKLEKAAAFHAKLAEEAN